MLDRAPTRPSPGRHPRHVLVTGGAGFIGSHTCLHLARSGMVPVVFDNFAAGHRHNVRWGPLVVGDLLDRNTLASTFGAFQLDAVLHFAALAHPGESVADPGRYYVNNVSGTLNLLEAMRVARVSSIVFSSTCHVFGETTGGLIGEMSALKPVSPYGRSKLVVEEMLADYVAAYGFRPAILRYFNAAGADPDGQLREEHDPETHLIPRCLRVAAGLDDAIEIHGADFATPDGTGVRDYIHVSDLAEAHGLALERLMERGEPLTFNLGTGRGWSVREVVAAVERVTGRAIAVRPGPRRAGDPARLVADGARAKRVLGFEAWRSDLDTVVRTAWAALPAASRPTPTAA